MDNITIQERTFNFAVRIIKLCTKLEEQKSMVATTLARQIIRAGTSISANGAEAKSASSTKDFIYKYEIALKEAQETKHWLRLLVASEVMPEKSLAKLIQENDEIICILAKTVVELKKKL